VWENPGCPSDSISIGSHFAIAAPNTQFPPSGRKPRSARILGLIALFVVLLGGAIMTIDAARDWNALAKARKLKNPLPPTSETIAAGAQIYANRCRSCHGERGDGKGDRAAELSVAPGDFTDASKMNIQTDGELYWQITRGRMPMPAFADKLSDVQRWQTVDYVRTFTVKQKPTEPGSPAGTTGTAQR